MRIRIAYVFGNLSNGGHNLQALKTILSAGFKENCIVVSLFETEGTSIESEIKANGIEVIALNLGKKSILCGIRNLREVVIRYNCNIVHSNGLKSDSMCYYAFHNTKIQHVITLHNYLKEDAYLRMGKMKAFIAVKVQSFILKRSQHIIACSEVLKQQMQSDNPYLKIDTIQNGVDTNQYKSEDMAELRKRYMIDQNKIIFISTGRMSSRKRIIETGKAFIMANLGNKAELWFVGDGEYFEEYKRVFSSIENIKFWGRRSDIPQLLNIADVFVSSSETEGLPLAVLEAISTGKKVYLSDIPQHKEILDKLTNCGYLYTLGHIDQLAKLFANTSKDKNQKSSSENVLKNTDFDINVMGRKYKEYYWKIVDFR